MSTKGVTYIKINRIDNEGNDNTLTLQGLTNIRIIYSDIGIVNYPVYSIAEYDDYYLYQLVTTNVTSSTDNNILNYTFLGQTSSFNGITSGIISFTSINDPLGYWTIPDQRYILETTPPFALTCSFTASITNTGPSNTSINLESELNGVLDSILLTGASSYPNVSLTYSGSFQSNDKIYVSYKSNDGFTVNSGTFRITQSVSLNSSLNQVVLEPYVTENFEFSDCNVLYGNIDLYPFNPLYMDVDYSTNGMIAVNTNQIIAGTAYRSTVKPYYYSLRRHIRPRYNGTENIDKGVWEFYDSFDNGGTALLLSSSYGLVDECSYMSSLSQSNRLIFTSEYSIPNINIGDNVFISQPKGVLANSGLKKVAGRLSIPYISMSVVPSYLHNILICEGDFVSGPTAGGTATLFPNTFTNSNIYPLDTFNSEIFEYRYGTTTFPEIPNAGMLVMGNILEVADQNNVNVLQQGSQYFEAYNKIINDIFTPNTTISDIRQYGDGKQVVLNNLQVITSEFGTPKSPQNAGDIVEYWIPTTNLPSSGYASTTDDDTIILLNDIFSVELNELNQYITGSIVSRVNIGNYISSSLQNGDRWFATFYENLPNPLDQSSLTPLNVFNNPFAYPTNDPYQTLLGNRGVVEIISSSISSSNARLLYTPRSSFGDLNIGGNNQKGLIIWKATTPSPKQGKYVIVSKPNINELGPGAIVLPDSNDAINNYYNEITTTYGTNTKPPTNQQSKNTSPKPSGPSGLSRR